ncbi:hypothetical protein SAMN05892877_1641 [Rhizobium subbaraonis]|uniref:AcrB/AcrD/AcrF family protein n=1 Tax=Rhizobium subbaraonis TaxID=908946 RepID=A0A285V2Q9_9HYPH|nr:hypothetical protein [Rhizobium subbaraonis]SOC48424.1 hypothetical protein SAMN05892877_1641 [Rhizobium subbaraonis]
MISNIIAWSARNLVLIIVAAALSIAAGIYCPTSAPMRQTWLS